MKRLEISTLALALVAGHGLTACGEQAACDEIFNQGPQVSIDLSLGDCNNRPVASFFLPSMIAKNTVVNLDGTASADIDDEPIGFQWTLVRRPPESATEIANPGAAETTMRVDVVGSYTLQLEVTDGDLISQPTQVATMVYNQAPIADAGSNVNVLPGSEVVLDGSQSRDPDGDSMTYTWSLVEAPASNTEMIANSMSSQARLRVEQEGVYTVELRVNDGDQDSAPSTVRIGAGVPISDNPPVADAGPDQAGLVGDTVLLNGSRSADPDGDALIYTWSIRTRPPRGGGVLTGTSLPQATLAPDWAGVWVVELSVFDGFFTHTDTVVITVTPNPNLLGPGTFDPSRIYVVGTLQEGLSGVDLLCDLASPNLPSAGFQDFHTDGLVHPLDGSYIYVDRGGLGPNTLRRFMPEPLVRDPDPDANRWLYPTNPLSNDTLIPTPACPEEAFRVLIHPVTGAIAYTCLGTPGAFDTDGNALDTCIDDLGEPQTPLALGFDGSVLCNRWIRDPDGMTHPLANSVNNPYRARPEGGFWRAERNDRVYERYIIHPDGTEELELTTAAVPNTFNFVNAEAQGWVNLDGEGNIFRWMFRDDESSTGDLIVQWPADGSPTEVMYDEDLDPICKLHGFDMISGP